MKLLAKNWVQIALKCTRRRLAAGLRLDPLGELKHSPRSLAAGPTSKGKEGEGREGEGRGTEGKGEKEGKKREGRGEG